MDDQDDRGYSRAPELEELLTLCRALNALGVRYVLIGGFAVILHGFVRATKHIALLIDASVENVQRLKRAIVPLRVHSVPARNHSSSRRIASAIMPRDSPALACCAANCFARVGWSR